MDVVELSRTPAALAVGERLFLNNCAQCHASDGGGSRGFPNLTDADWLWGSEPKTIRQTIAEGRTGTMPPFGAALGEQSVKDVAHYVLSLSGRTHDSLRRARGEPLFKSTCAACHGAEGKGNPVLGAVLGMAIIIHMFVAAAAGPLVPLGVRAANIDPALASSVFITTMTDVVGFLSFLGLAAVFAHYLVSG
jgi:cbb3-type cytochrome c oxidase subunit III